MSPAGLHPNSDCSWRCLSIAPADNLRKSQRFEPATDKQTNKRKSVIAASDRRLRFRRRHEVPPACRATHPAVASSTTLTSQGDRTATRSRPALASSPSTSVVDVVYYNHRSTIAGALSSCHRDWLSQRG